MMRNVYSVGQVNTYIKNMFAQDFMLGKISVKGEVSNCKYHTSGHIYFSLKDEGSVIGAVMFAGNRRNGLKFDMRDGDHVVVTGSVEVYERDGRYQLYAREVTLDGAGALFLKFEALKKELAEMGMFDQGYKRPIPKYIQTLGIVTAPTGAAVQDIRNISRRRNPYVQLILYPAQVQGDGAAQSIVNGSRALEQLGADVIIAGRGGGSIEDLWAFNEEIVARAIFECTVPVISAVGHETDTTIADYVADLRAPTPSAAAELAVYDYRQFREALRVARTALDLRMREHIHSERQKAAQLMTKLGYLSPRMILNSKKQYLADLEDRLIKRMEYRVSLERHRIQLLAGRLEAGSPVKKLSGGFSYVTDSAGNSLTSVMQIKLKDTISVQTVDGRLKAEVLEIESDESMGIRK